MLSSCHPNLLSPWVTVSVGVRRVDFSVQPISLAAEVQNLFSSEVCRADELLLVRRPQLRTSVVVWAHAAV